MREMDREPRNDVPTSRVSPVAMAKKPIPPEDVIREESEPSITEPEETPRNNPDTVGVDIDDAQIEEPKDDAFRKSPQPVKAAKRRKKA
jgi:hypothetical protein